MEKTPENRVDEIRSIALDKWKKEFELHPLRQIYLRIIRGGKPDPFLSDQFQSELLRKLSLNVFDDDVLPSAFESGFRNYSVASYSNPEDLELSIKKEIEKSTFMWIYHSELLELDHFGLLISDSFTALQSRLDGFTTAYIKHQFESIDFASNTTKQKLNKVGRPNGLTRPQMAVVVQLLKNIGLAHRNVSQRAMGEAMSLLSGFSAKQLRNDLEGKRDLLDIVDNKTEKLEDLVSYFRKAISQINNELGKSDKISPGESPPNSF